MNPQRPYPPNNDPRSYGINQGVGRLLDRIWQPGAQYSPNPASFGLYTREHGRAPVGWLPSDRDALATYVTTQPERAPERIASFDAMRQLDTTEEAFALIDGGATAYELARVDVQVGLLMLESIETWARVRELAPDGPAATADELLPREPGALATSGPQLRGLGTPFPFPISHIDAAGSPVSIEWVLVLDRGNANQRSANMLGPSPVSQVPAVAGTPPYWPHRWEDMRYPWCCDQPHPQQWSATGPGVLRLFAIVKCEPLDGGTLPAWEIQLSGRLRGYMQPAGPSGAAFYNVTRRN